MLRITIDLVPFGVEEYSRNLATGKVWNTTPVGRAGLHDYAYQLESTSPLDTLVPLPKRPQRRRRGKVCGFPRNKLTVWDLLYRVLKEAVGDRNDEPSSSTKKPKRKRRSGKKR